MKKLVKLTAAAATLLVCAPSFALGGVLGNGQATLTNVLADVPGTVTNLLGSLPGALSDGATAVSNTVQALPGILTGSPITSTTASPSLNLPGPGLLPGTTTLVNIPDQLGVSMNQSDGSYSLTITTGP